MQLFVLFIYIQPCKTSQIFTLLFLAPSLNSRADVRSAAAGGPDSQIRKYSSTEILGKIWTISGSGPGVLQKGWVWVRVWEYLLKSWLLGCLQGCQGGQSESGEFRAAALYQFIWKNFSNRLGHASNSKLMAAMPESSLWNQFSYCEFLLFSALLPLVTALRHFFPSGPNQPVQVQVLHHPLS